MRKTYLVNTTRGLVLVPTLHRAKELAETSAMRHKNGHCFYAAVRRHAWDGIGVLYVPADARCQVQVAHHMPEVGRYAARHETSTETWKDAFGLSDFGTMESVFAEL